MSDALLSAPVAVGAGVAAVALLAVAGSKIRNNDRSDLVSMMGVMGAFIFAAQMVNFSIPGTGSSGHIVGGVLLAALLGPWAGFITLTSVLVIQCLVFADGGLMALGCNILNMGAMTCLVAYPFIYRPLMRYPASAGRIMWVSVLACTVGLELGALLVTAETALSGITALSGGDFLALMCSIHLPIGICEGVATGAVVCFVQKSRPQLLGDGISAVGREASESAETHTAKRKGLNSKGIWWCFAIAAALIAGGLAFLASSDPDGLEWSIWQATGQEELAAQHTSVLSQAAEHAQNATAMMPDYSSPLSGIVGALIVMALVWTLSTLIMRRRRCKRSVAQGRQTER